METFTFEHWYKRKALAIAFITNGEQGVRLAVQLLGEQPCPTCDYNHKHCKCSSKNLALRASQS